MSHEIIWRGFPRCIQHSKKYQWETNYSKKQEEKCEAKFENAAKYIIYSSLAEKLIRYEKYATRLANITVRNISHEECRILLKVIDEAPSDEQEQ